MFFVVSHNENPTYNIKSNTNIKNWYKCIRTFKYFPIQIFVRIIFVSFVWYEYIRIFVHIILLIRIYSDIRLYHFFDTNIFGYSFVSFFGNKYIRIFVRIKNSYSPHPDPYLDSEIPIGFMVSCFCGFIVYLSLHSISRQRDVSWFRALHLWTARCRYV